MSDTATPFGGIDFAQPAADQIAREILQEAMTLGASDVMLIRQQDHLRLAMRRLGVVERFDRIPPSNADRLTLAIKTLAKLDISDRRHAQDGRIRPEAEDGIGVAVRINTLPTLYGEDVNMRFMVRQGTLMAIDELGLLSEQRQQLDVMLNTPSGLICVTGPASNGKTTTLYACLQTLNVESRTINTIEDPVEYSLPGVRQSQVNLRMGVDFPDILRAILRQSPDIIMVGEIRDPITAQTAVRAANSGHLVLATLNAPVAAAAIQSFIAFGVEPYFLATALSGIIAQRLIRILDETTRVEYDMTDSPQSFDDVRPWLAKEDGHAIFGPGESTRTSPEGFSGLTAVFELLAATPQIRRLIAQGNPASDIQKLAEEQGMINFRRSSMIKVARGVTSTEEVLRAVPFEYLGVEV